MNDRLRVLQRQPRRISITLSYHVHEALLSRSEEEGRSVSNLCAFLLEDALRDTGRNLHGATMASPPMRTLGQSHNGVHPNGAPVMRQHPRH
jgi:hypothetical protein